MDVNGCLMGYRLLVYVPASHPQFSHPFHVEFEGYYLDYSQSEC